MTLEQVGQDCYTLRLLRQDLLSMNGTLRPVYGGKTFPQHEEKVFLADCADETTTSARWIVISKQ